MAGGERGTWGELLKAPVHPIKDPRLNPTAWFPIAAITNSHKQSALKQYTLNAL